MTPDGLRAYIVHQGAQGTTPLVQVLWALPGVSSFGKPFPGGPINLGTVREPLEMLFAPDGNTGYVGSLRLVGGPASVRRFDTRPGSPSYHKQTGIVSFPGRFMFDFEITADGTTVFAPVGPLGGNTEVMLIDAKTLALIDVDPGAPGIQGIGGEKSVPRTPTGRVVGGIVAGPRGRFLFVSTAGPGGGRVIKVNVDRTSSSFRKFVVYTTGNPACAIMGGMAISDAGDLLYVAVRGGGIVQEVDAAAMRLKRTFRISSPGVLALR